MPNIYFGAPFVFGLCFSIYFVSLQLMLKLLIILLTALCSTIGLSGELHASERYTSSSEELVSRYVVQIECEHRYNNTPEHSTTITVPTSNISYSAARGQQSRVSTATSTLHTISARCNYCIQFSLYRTTSRRVIDYYLYALCQLRL